MENELLKLRGDKPLSNKEFYSRTWKYLKPEIWTFVLAIFLVFVNVLLDTISPLFIEAFINMLTKESQSFPFNLLNLELNVGNVFLLTGTTLGIAIVAQAILFAESMLLQKAGQKIILKLRIDVFNHIEEMSINQFNDMPVGSLVTRVCNYTESMSNLFTDTLISLLRNFTTVVVVLVIMFVKVWQLTLVILGIVVVILAATIIFKHYIGKAFRKERTMVSDLNAFLNENLAGMKITQLFNQQARKREDFKKKNVALRKQRFNVVVCFALYRPFVQFLYYAALALIFIVGINLSLSAGLIVSFYLLISKFFNPIQNLADQLNQIQNAKTAAERIYNLLDVKPQVLDKPDAKEVGHFEGKIEFKHVWFAYEKENWILKDVSFVIEPKTTCAFVGATGAGKTTILSLIVRNYEIQKGRILIDGIDISTIKIDCLRKAIGQMLQDVFLFSGTIKSNITLHGDEFNDEEIMETCKYVNADSFINKLENGLNSEVVERGENFSQGQRQLLSFARTILHKPQILILDEATANIDTETERLIQDSLEKMKSIGTMLVVAHRLSTIQNSNQIICLQNGEIVEKGTHQELLKKRGYYYKLYLLQFDGKD